MPGENFQVNMKETFANMTEKLSEFPFLQVTPPLQLKEAGQPGPLPVLLGEELVIFRLTNNLQLAEHQKKRYW
ncbi:hypothetical protein CRUP_002291 [Coryphaenoides rupestris]|nr:hypothetical protein CRUP_002291 [Coryphaenoides rupestris]